MEHLYGKITEEFKKKCVHEAKEKASETTLSIEDISVCTIDADDGSGPEEEEWLRTDMEMEEEKSERKINIRKTSASFVFLDSTSEKVRLLIKRGSSGLTW